MSLFTDGWRSSTPLQKRNIGFYIAGIFCYKFALGSITTLAVDRYNAANTFTKLGAASGLNQAMQCVGAILIAPLAARFASKNVLSAAVVMFGVMITILLISDAATGGKVRHPGGKVQYGSWNPNAIFPIWGSSGIAYGTVELIRRVIPADICGEDILRLRRIDAIVHVLYEIAGTSAAFASSAAITRSGNNTSYFISPVLFTLAGVAWYFITPPQLYEKSQSELAELERSGMGQSDYLKQVVTGAWDFVRSVYVGAKIIFTHRKFCWLFTAYSVPLYLHRYLGSDVGPAFARRVLNTSASSQILVGGSSFGELLGALSVFMLATKIPTPISWLRMDALALNLMIWAVPSIARIAVEKEVRWAWYVAALNVGISFGWAAGDVSLAAYIQTSLQSMHITELSVSPARIDGLRPVMCLLAVTSSSGISQSRDGKEQILDEREQKLDKREAMIERRLGELRVARKGCLHGRHH